VKTRITLLTRWGVCVSLTLLSSTLAWSQYATPYPPSGPYLKVDLGGEVAQDTDLKDFFGVAAPGAKVQFDPGVRVGFAGGYQVTEWFSAEFETGVMENRIRSITGADYVDNAYFGNVPLLVNAKLQLPNPSRFTPYIGGGAGGAVSFLDVDGIRMNGVRLQGDSADAVFAWQGFAGVRYAINPWMGLSLEYHYFAADSPNWEADFVHGPVVNNSLRFGQTRIHAVSLAFDFRF
jgi:OmpA-OmpF porin, OOP family